MNRKLLLFLTLLLLFAPAVFAQSGPVPPDEQIREILVKRLGERSDGIFP